MNTAPLSDEELLTRLSEITPELFTETELLAEWSSDFWPSEAKMEFEEAVLPVAAVMPSDAEEVAAIVRLAALAGRPLIPRGGGTNLVGAIEPLPGAILIDLRGLNVIDPVNERNSTVRVDAGVHGGELADRLEEQGFMLGHEPESLLISTIGGWIATRGVGTFGTGYGGIGSLVVSLDVILPDGSAIAVGTGVRAGPALAELFIGSEGAFGIVTAATLRVRPIPEKRLFHAFAHPLFTGGLEALRALIATGVVPAATKLFDETASESIAYDQQISQPGCLMFLIFEGPGPIVEVQDRLATELLIASGAVDLGSEPAEIWNDERIGSLWYSDGNEGDGRIADRIDLFAPWDSLDRILTSVGPALTALGVAFSIDSSQILPHGADLCFGIQIEAEDDDAALDLHEAAWTAVMELALTGGARIAHRHGYGRVRTAWLAREFGASHAALGAIKRALDPLGIMNPGRLLL